MFCTSCGGRLGVVEVLRDTDDIYRRRKCKKCGRLLYSHEVFIEPDDSFRATWNECDRNARSKNKEENK